MHVYFAVFFLYNPPLFVQAGCAAVLFGTTFAALIAYRWSPTFKANERLGEALSPFEELAVELCTLRQILQNKNELSTRHYVESTHLARLKAIRLEELKKFATGLRLQALKDVRIESVADLQGVNEFKLSQVPGLGPKSASAIVRAAAHIIQTTKSLSMTHPLLPFVSDIERELMETLYQQRWFDIHVEEQSKTFEAELDRHRITRDQILMHTTFGRWLWKFGSTQTIRASLDQANETIKILDGHARSIRESLAASLRDFRAVCGERLPSEPIVQDYLENRDAYSIMLTSRLGTPSEKTATELIPHRESLDPPDASELSHVRASHLLPNFPPSAISEGAKTLLPLETVRETLEGLISVSITSSAAQHSVEFALPKRQATETSQTLRWLTKGDSVQIQGQTLPYGFVYVGSGINFEQYFAIDPELTAKGASGTPDAEGSYFFSYFAYPPDRRFRYLQWLAAGASSAAESDFGMLYFYGLERRVLDLVQGKTSDPPQQELELLLEELNRIGELFRDKPTSVTQCCVRLADFAYARQCDGITVPELPNIQVKTYELPFVVRYALGCFMKERRPIPVEWALRWAYSEPTIYLRTPAIRCPREFDAAFAAIYRERFGDGIIVPANKTRLKLAYQPGWPMHLETEVKYSLPGVPDVAALSGPQQSLKVVVDKSTEMIDGYSRYLGRNVARTGTLEALLNLPLRIWPSEDRDRWVTFLGSIVDPMQPVSFEIILRHLGYSDDPALAKINELVTNLEGARVGFEPDILAASRRPKPSDMVVLFRLTSDSDSDRTTSEYKKASLAVSLSACVALADGIASQDEALAVEAMISSWLHLHVDLRTRLLSQYRLQVKQGASLAGFKSRLATLDDEGKLQLALALSSLAAADGNIAAAEVKLLEQVYQALGLEARLLYSHLHGRTSPGQRVPSPSLSNIPANVGRAVDAARLVALRRETEQVSAMLAEVFAEEDVPTTGHLEPPILANSSKRTFQEELLPGLDAGDQRFLAELLEKPSWSRSELKAMSARLQLMLDGALERINEAAFEFVGEAITEGDDPICVQQNLLGKVA